MARPRPGWGRGGHEGARARQPRRGVAPPQGQARRDHHGQRAAGAEDRRPGGRPPFGPPEVKAMSRAISPATSHVYVSTPERKYIGTPAQNYITSGGN